MFIFSENGSKEPNIINKYLKIVKPFIRIYNTIIELYFYSLQ